MVDRKNLIEQFVRRAGYVPNVEEPETFNEKLLYRKLYDHDPFLGTLVDKIESKKVAKDVAGLESAKILWEGKNVEEIPFIVPSVIKMNAASGRQWPVTRALSEGEKRLVRDSAASSLLSTYGAKKGEWAYGIVPKKIFVEEWLGEVQDWKFFVFHGEVKVIVDMRYEGGKIKSLSMFRPDRSKIEASVEPFANLVEELRLSEESLKEGIKIAEAMGISCDFVRCDVYYREEDRKWFFGEYTIYPTSGMARYKPRSFDKELGSYWRYP